MNDIKIFKMNRRTSVETYSHKSIGHSIGSVIASTI